MEKRIYTKQDATEKMKNSVNYYAVRIAAWKNVQRVTKKDGGNFAVLSKNFVNAQFLTEYHINKIQVHFMDENGRYCSDYISLDGNAYTKEPAATTPELVQDRINKIINNYIEWMEKDQKGLDQIENQIDQITPELEKIKNIIDKAKEETNTHYTLQNYIKNYLHILND